MTDSQLIAAGVPADLIRISIGLENIGDLISDVSQALEKLK
jgi:O-acetylhomoserine (thiol)-lyase